MKRTYIIINTADYNNDGQYAVTEATDDTLADNGLWESEIETCRSMAVGDIAPSESFFGVYFMRVI